MTIEKAFEVYKEIRDKIDQIKKEVGFTCKMCGTCCTQNIPVVFEDYWLMRESRVSLEGLKVIKGKNGIIYGVEMLCDKKDRNTGICFYEDQENNKCSIHHSNPMLCHSFPFVCSLVRFKDEEAFFIHKSCSWMEDNFDGFFVKISQRDQILELIHKFREIEYNIEDQSDERINEFLSN